VSIGVDGVLASTGYTSPFLLMSIPLLSLGVYTILFSAVARDWRYYLVWGLILSSIGASLILTPATGNLMLNLSVSLIIIVLVGVIVSRKRS
jgi:hypothetical protein